MTTIHTTPATFAADLASLAEGDTILLADGIYAVNGTLQFQHNSITMQAESGARPLITNAAEKSPNVGTLVNCALNGIWLGGARDTDIDTVMTLGANASLTDCTLFNYTEAVASGNNGNVISGCRFVNCGFGVYLHDIYLSGNNGSVEDNIFIGGEGYKLHLYAAPQNMDVLRNFAAPLRTLTKNSMFIAHYGSGKIDDNVFWQPVADVGYADGPAVTLGGMSSGDVTHNLFAYSGPFTATAGVTYDRNASVGWTHVMGTNKTDYAREDTESVLGITADALDTACKAVSSSFTGTTNVQILADTTIEQNFAIIDAARLAWVGNTPAPEPTPEPAPAPDTTFVSPRRSGRVILLIQNNPEEEAVEITRDDTGDDEVTLTKHTQMARSNWKIKEDE